MQFYKFLFITKNVDEWCHVVRWHHKSSQVTKNWKLFAWMWRNRGFSGGGYSSGMAIDLTLLYKPWSAPHKRKYLNHRYKMMQEISERLMKFVTTNKNMSPEPPFQPNADGWPWSGSHSSCSDVFISIIGFSPNGPIACKNWHDTKSSGHLNFFLPKCNMFPGVS